MGEAREEVQALYLHIFSEEIEEIILELYALSVVLEDISLENDGRPREKRYVNLLRELYCRLGVLHENFHHIQNLVIEKPSKNDVIWSLLGMGPEHKQ